MRASPLLAALLVAATTAGHAQQLAAPAGAASCSGCHASAARPSAIPSLEGRAPAEIFTAMRDFRAGRRHATLMDRIAKGFTDDELAALAAYVAEPRR